MSNSAGSPRPTSPLRRAAELVPLALGVVATVALAACSAGDATYTTRKIGNRGKQAIIAAAESVQQEIDALQGKTPETKPPDKKPVKPRPKSRGKPPGNAADGSPPTSPTETDTSPQEVTETTPLGSPSPDTSTTPPADAPVDDTIYSGADPDVVPPRLIRSQVSTPVFLAWAREVNVIELLVSATGAVEEARLVSELRRLTDVQMLNSAKGWAFEPARRAGVAVRYRLVVSWESTP